MVNLEEYIFSFQDLLGHDQATNQRWVELMEVIDQLYDEFVYPELERTKKLKSIYTADEQDLDAINVDKYYYLFESIQQASKTKRIALWMQQEIIKAKNRDDSIMLAIASLGLPREALDLVKMYSSKTIEYTLSSLRSSEQIEDKSEYFLTSKKGFYLDQSMLEGLGFDPYTAQESVRNVLSENVVPVWMELLILQKLEAEKSAIKVSSFAKSFESLGSPVGGNRIDYRMYNQVAETKSIPSVTSYNQFIF